MNALRSLFQPFSVPTVSTSLPRISTSARDALSRNECVHAAYCMFMGLYPSSASWIHYSWAEHLPRIHIYQLCLLSLPRNSVQTRSEKCMPIWPAFLDVQQPRKSDISSDMRQNQENPETWLLYLLQDRWAGRILSWKTLSSFQ